MEFDWIWQTILIFFTGKFILRLGGRKSISQITITQVIVMIGIGSLLIQPVSGKGLIVTFGVAFLLTLLMILTEYLEMKVDFCETFLTGKAVVVVEKGEINIKNLKKIRMTVDRLETRIRQSGISSIDDIEFATIEVSGQIGYVLKDSKKPLTKDDFIKLMGGYLDTHIKQSITKDIFKEIKTKEFEGNRNEP